MNQISYSYHSIIYHSVLNLLVKVKYFILQDSNSVGILYTKIVLTLYKFLNKPVDISFALLFFAELKGRKKQSGNVVLIPEFISNM